MGIVHIWMRIIKPIAIPNLLRTLAVFYLTTFVVSQLLGDGAGEFLYNLMLLPHHILSGEIWRLISWIAIPGRGGGALSLIFMLFLMIFLFFLNDIIEEGWGVVGTNAYFWACVVAIVFASFVEMFVAQVLTIPVLSSSMLWTSLVVGASLIAPYTTIHLFAIIPVQLRFIGILSGAMLILFALDTPAAIPFILIGMSPCLAILIPTLYKASAQRAAATHRRSKFEAGKLPEGNAFHTCSVCGTNDIKSPDESFRVLPDGNEICESCLEKKS